MRSVSILSLASLLALAVAQPAHQKRDIVTVTLVETIIKTIDVTSTIYADEVPEATPVAQPSHVAGSHHHGHQHAHQHPKPSVSSVEVADPPHTHVHSPKPHTHTEEIPSPTPVPPPTTTAAPVPSTPTTTKVAPAPTSTQAAPPSGGAPASTFSGDMTHYAPGLGSCGITSSASEPVVALAVPMMANPANPNDNPKCGQKITIEFDGQQHEATVMDTCYACAMGDIDLSPTLFKAVAPTGDGRVPDVKWWFNNPTYN